MQNSLPSFINDWDQIKGDLRNGLSVLVSAPRHFGKNFFLSNLLPDYWINKKYTLLVINLYEKKANKLNYKKVWGDMERQLRLKYGPIIDKNDFIDAVLDLTTKKNILFILNVKQKNKVLAVELLNTFQEISHQHPRIFINNSALMVLDDLSLFFYEQSTKSEFSFWDLFRSKRKIFQLTDSKPIRQMIAASSELKEWAEAYGEIIYELTGGHHGLIYLACNFLIKDYRTGPPEQFRRECEQFLLTTEIMDSIKNTLDHLRKRDLEMALAFREKQMLDSKFSKGMESLLEDGIILRSNARFSILCPGIIKEMAESIYTNNFAAALNIKTNTSLNQSSSSEDVPKKIFISYAREDEGMKEKIERFLIDLIRDESAVIWQDRELKGGDEFEEKISKELEEAHIILLLVSQDFISSEFIYTKELVAAMERHESKQARVVPVILRICNWETQIFGKLNAIPRDGKPIKKFNDEDEAYTLVAKEITKLVKDHRK